MMDEAYADFVALCVELRAMGATEVADGGMSVKFGPAPVKPLPVKPKVRKGDLDPEEWRAKAAVGNR